MKIFWRLVVANMIAAYIVAFLFPFSISKPIVAIQKEEKILLLWLLITIIGGLAWWFYMFYHWGKNQFTTTKIKITWFLIILFGTMIYLAGPILYYVLVFERGLGLIKTRNELVSS